MPSAYVRGSVNTAADEAGDITAKSSSATGMKKGPVTSLAGLLKEEQALTKQEGEEEKKNDSNMLKIDDKEESKAVKAETAVTHELAVDEKLHKPMTSLDVQMNKKQVKANAYTHTRDEKAVEAGLVAHGDKA